MRCEGNIVMTDKNYEPVSCDWHDELEAAAMHKTEVVLEIETDGTRGSQRGRIADVFSRDGEEFARLEYGDGSIEIRLDRIVGFREAEPSN